MQKSKIKLKIRFYVMFISKLDCFIINFFYKLSSLIFKFVFFFANSNFKYRLCDQEIRY